MTDAFVQVATDGTGKKIDNAALTREPADPARDATQGDTVYRQRVVIASDDDESQTIKLHGEVGREAIPVDSNTLEKIHATLEQIKDLLELALST
jgi:hypothetical protein